MGQPRQGISAILASQDLIIEALYERPRWARARDLALTAAVWLAYVWLVSDFFVFLRHLWNWLFRHAARPEELPSVLPILQTIGSYAVVVWINGALLLGWALYNQIRFRGKNRRKSVPRITLQELSQAHRVPVSEVAAWRSASILVVHHDENGGWERVDIPGPEQRDAPAMA